MKTQKISPNEAYKKIYDVTATAVHHTSKGYKATHAVTKFLADTVTDNTLCRITGIKYYMNTIHAVVGMFKHSETEKIKDILKQPEMSMKQKIKEVGRHVGKNFSHEATVAAGVFFGKEALVVAPLAITVATVVGFFAPAAAATAGYVAAGGLTAGAMWFLGTHQGHAVEASAAEKISKAREYIKNMRGAAKGTIPEYKQMHDVSQAMHEAGMAHHRHSQQHHHGHHHAGHTLKQDLKAMLHVHKYPQELANYTRKVVQCAKCMFKEDRGPHHIEAHQQQAAHVKESRFMKPQEHKPEIKKHLFQHSKRANRNMKV